MYDPTSNRNLKLRFYISVAIPNRFDHICTVTTSVLAGLPKSLAPEGAIQVPLFSRLMNPNGAI